MSVAGPPGAGAPPQGRLPAPLLEALAARAPLRQFRARAVIVSEDDRGSALYIIQSGRAKVYGSSSDGREIVYNSLGPGEYFGEMTLDGGPRSASVMALEPTGCLVLDGEAVQRALADEPALALHLVHKLIALNRLATLNLKSFALQDVYGRVARVLQALAREEGGGPTVRGLTQQDIAERVGASREMVSRILGELKRGGYVRLEPGAIVLAAALPARW